MSIKSENAVVLTPPITKLFAPFFVALDNCLYVVSQTKLRKCNVGCIENLVRLIIPREYVCLF
jgi:hypothetical protein